MIYKITFYGDTWTALQVEEPLLYMFTSDMRQQGIIHANNFCKYMEKVRGCNDALMGSHKVDLSGTYRRISGNDHIIYVSYTIGFDRVSFNEFNVEEMLNGYFSFLFHTLSQNLTVEDFLLEDHKASMTIFAS